MGPYIVNGHYMYGSTFIQPHLPYYTRIRHHKVPAMRILPEQAIRDDGQPYKPAVTNCDNDCEACGCSGVCDALNGEIVRSSLATNLVNIETSIVRQLKVTLYGTKEELDKTIYMEVGKRYAIVYLTESGLNTAVGILKEIDDGIPDDCTRYIGTFGTTVAQSYIGVDCSTAGNSDKRLIYIASIRDIVELEEDEEYEIQEATLTASQKLDKILEMIEDGLTYIGEELDTIEDPEIPKTKEQYIASINSHFDSIKSILDALASTTDATDCGCGSCNNNSSESEEIPDNTEEESTDSEESIPDIVSDNSECNCN